MARTAGQNVDIRIKAYNEASPGLDAVANSIRKLPGELSKAAAVFQMVGGAAGGMGEDVAQAAGKMSALASLVSSGGPIGIGIAAVTVAVAAGSKVWELYNSQTTATAGMNATLAGTFEAMNKDLSKSQSTLQELTDKLIYWGKTAEEMQIGKLKETVAIQDVAIISNRKQADSIRASAEAMLEKAEAQEKDSDLEYLAHLRGQETAKQLRDRAGLELQTAAALEEGTSKAEAAYYVNVNTITALEELTTKTKAKTAAEKEAGQVASDLADENRRFAQDAAAMADASFNLYKQDISQKRGMSEWLRAATESDRKRTERDDERDRKGSELLAEAGQHQYDDLKSTGVSAARSISAAWTEAGVAMASGSASGSEAAKQAVFGSARAAIMAASGEAAAKSIAAYSGIPFVGVAIGLSVAASVAAIILGYLSKFEQGGIVRGSGGGIPIMAHDGERVLSARQTMAFERMVSALERQSTTRAGASVVGNGGIIQMNRYSTFAPSSSATRRDMREVMSLTLKLKKRGY
jgi:hypothetical protein